VVVPAPSNARHETAFIVLKEGRIHFEGDANELQRSPDAYVKSFLTGWIPPLVA
jgi:ABC-type transporter Mla maintaining outer membrane lipid asymmetry ATPase subunit MlaF